MARLMRCQYCGVLQDEPVGAKTCIRCGGELAFETGPRQDERDSYLQVQMELDQVMAPAGENIERYLLVTLRTPAQVPPGQAAQVRSGRPPLNLAAVLDVSGSMSGEKLQNAKSALREALMRLYDGDVLSLVTFDSEVRCPLEPTRVDDHIRSVFNSLLQEIRAGSNTALCRGLELGIEKALSEKKQTNLLLLLSDGLANEGETITDKIAQRARDARGKGLVVSTLGVGDDYNEVLMAALADQGGGHFYHVREASEIGAYLTTELGDVANAAAREVELHLTVPGGVVLMPFSAAYPVKQDGSRVTLAIGYLPCDTELEIPVTIAVPAQQQGTKLAFEGDITYESPAGNRLKNTLNRVTLRIAEKNKFTLRDGVIAPVAERVLQQLKDANVLQYSWALRQSPAAARAEVTTRVSKIRSYAALLGKEREAQEAEDVEAQFDLAASPVAGIAKQAFAAAYSRQRKSKQR